MKVLVVGSGGREHAFAWKIAQSNDVSHVYVAPGNAGTAQEPGVSNIAIDACDIDALLKFAKQEAIDLTLVGPEAPLSLGIVDQFNAQGLDCFGPSQAAAQLESSKAYAKYFMNKYAIPTANYREFNDCQSALNYVQDLIFPQVIKADGLAAGKGVIIAQDLAEAEAAIRDMLSNDSFGKAGHKIIIEDFLRGEEASFIVCTDGNTIIPMASSQDHKARDEGDLGPNTGGMGAYSPAPCVNEAVTEQILKEIIQPTLDGMRQEGQVYRGFLYAGVMISPSGDISVLEFNCRSGDPETQPMMMRLESCFFQLCRATVKHKLANYSIEWSSEPAIGIVLAAAGYPGHYQKNNVIHGLDQAIPEQCKIFHAGTLTKDRQTLTAGGRVLCIVAKNPQLQMARKVALEVLEKIHWAGGQHYRRDIAWRALN